MYWLSASPFFFIPNRDLSGFQLASDNPPPLPVRSGLLSLCLSVLDGPNPDLGHVRPDRPVLAPLWGIRVSFGLVPT